MMYSPLPHFLASVYITNQQLRNHSYDLGFTSKFEDPLFRIGRFITALRSFTNIEWKTVSIYFDLDPSWRHHSTDLRAYILKLFPQANIEEHRLLTPKQWRGASNLFHDNDVIYLHTNDDHAFVAQDDVEFRELINSLRAHEGDLAYVTHFPEAKALLARAQWVSPETSSKHSVMMTSTVGTCLLRADFFKSWWREGLYFGEDELIARPDNPLGRSLTFSPKTTLIPKTELIRHMDGYAHVAIGEPITAIRNTLRWETDGSVTDLGVWEMGIWPKQTFAITGFLPDLILTNSKRQDGVFRRTRICIGYLQTIWSMRISFINGLSLAKEKHRLNRILVFPIALFVLFTRPIRRNLIDKIFDLPFLLVTHILSTKSIICRNLKLQVLQLGTWRALRQLKKR